MLKMAWTVSHLPATTDQMAAEVRALLHLRGVKAPGGLQGQIDFLIGTDVPSAYVPMEARREKDAELYAVCKALGWAVGGPNMSGSTSENPQAKIWAVFDVADSAEDCHVCAEVKDDHLVDSGRPEDCHVKDGDKDDGGAEDGRVDEHNMSTAL